MKHTRWGIIMIVGLTSSILPIACASSRDTVARPVGSTGDATDALSRPDDSAEIPCEPRRVLTTICQQCHTRPETRNGAPFPLERRSDVLATYGGIEIRQLMIEQVSSGRMPLAPVTMAASDRALLLSWLSAGAPAVTPQTCAAVSEGGAGDASADGPEDNGDADSGVSVDSATPIDEDAGDDGGAEEFQ